MELIVRSLCHLPPARIPEARSDTFSHVRRMTFLLDRIRAQEEAEAPSLGELVKAMEERPGATGEGEQGERVPRSYGRGELLFARRLRPDLSLEDLAYLLRMRSSTLSKWMRRYHVVPPKPMARLWRDGDIMGRLYVMLLEYRLEHDRGTDGE